MEARTRDKIWLAILLPAIFVTICSLPFVDSYESEVPKFNIGPFVIYKGIPYWEKYSVRKTNECRGDNASSVNVYTTTYEALICKNCDKFLMKITKGKGGPVIFWRYLYSKCSEEHPNLIILDAECNGKFTIEPFTTKWCDIPVCWKEN